MEIHKTDLLKNICYTELVYGRINKKLRSNFSKAEIEKLISAMIEQTPEQCFQRTGKNIYVSNIDKNIQITINSNTFRIITVDKISTAE